MNTKWSGVFPAVTTKFDDSFKIDFKAVQNHTNAQIEAGVHGIILCGSLGESGTLTTEEKHDLLRATLEVVNRKVPVMICVAERTTAAATDFVQKADKIGADGYMVLPPMQYVSDSRETMTYLRTVAAATNQPIMIYNNPVAYGVDVTPQMFAELADEAKFVAIKESSDNVRRITDIVNLVGDRYQIFTGVDNIAMESLILGACGWVAGLVCAFPRETVAIYELVQRGRIEEARAIYRWFMPLLHLDVSTKLVQNIKLAEAMVGLGSETVRPPRLNLVGEERTRVKATIAAALESRPELPRW